MKKLKRPKNVNINFRINNHDRDAWNKQAEKEGISTTDFITTIINNYIAEHNAEDSRD